MPDYTLTVGASSVAVVVTEEPTLNVSEAMTAHPIIGRTDPRVVATGNMTTEFSYDVAVLSSAGITSLEAILGSGEVVTITAPDASTRLVRIKSWTRVKRSAVYARFSFSTIKAV